MILYLLLLLVCCLITIYLTAKWLRLRPYNQCALNIKTFDGFDSPYHPSVLYFEKGWNGYKYWMAETPFSPKCKPYRDRNECPSIHVSNDGINWTEIDKNPIDDLTGKEIEELDYFSDPHLVFVNGHIECWYRITHRGGIKDNYNNLQLVRKCSKDGTRWGKREILVNLATEEGNSLGNMVVSPAIIYQEGTYRMWYVNSESRKERCISYSESPDGKNWTVCKICTLNGDNNIPWHIDVNYINGKYFLLSYDFKNLTLWESSNGITFCFIKEILNPSVIGSFYERDLYRSCIIHDNRFKVYFSASDSLKTRIGLMEGENLGELEVYPLGKHQNLISLSKYICKTKWITVTFVTRQLFHSKFKKASQ